MDLGRGLREISPWSQGTEWLVGKFWVIVDMTTLGRQLRIPFFSSQSLIPQRVDLIKIIRVNPKLTLIHLDCPPYARGGRRRTYLDK